MVRLTDRLNMTIAVDLDIKPQIKQTKTYPISISHAIGNMHNFLGLSLPIS